MSQRGARTAACVLLAIAVLAVAAPLIAPYDPDRLLDPLRLRSSAPTAAHPFGTDPSSRDVLSRMLFGARVSLGLAIASVAMGTAIGTAVGVGSGYIGGRVDRLAMRVVDVMLAVPRVLLLLTIVGLWGGMSVPALALVLAATGWMGISRLVRGEVLALRGQERLVAARALGVSHLGIVRRHLLPSLVPLVAIAASAGVGQVLLLESGLSFLGLGVPAPKASWGSVILDLSDVLGPQRWLVLLPGAVLVTTVVAIHRLGDAIDAALTPEHSA